MSLLKNKNLKQKVLIVIFSLIFLFVFLNFLKAWFKGRQVNSEINNLEQEISTLQKDTAELTELIQYFNSSAYIEEKARVDLGLKKEGEKVVLITDDLKKNLESGEKIEEKNAPRSNLKKWWDYFFNKNYGTGK